MRSIVILLISYFLASCSASSIETQPAQLGVERTLEELEASLTHPGVIEFKKHIAADWAVNLSGLVNLEHPTSKAAGLEDRMEPIQIYTYSIKHPSFGTALIDSGVASTFTDPATNQDVASPVKMFMGLEALDLHLDTAELNTQLGGIDAVFLTHIHLDHIMGLKDLDDSVKVYIGPGDAGATEFLNIATQSTTDNLLGNVSRLFEWQYSETGIIDVFGDGSLWAIHSPGHTPGATAYLANTTRGIELMLGDVTHTKWGWENGVEPGTFSSDIPGSKSSLQRLMELAGRHPNLKIHPGHQSL